MIERENRRSKFRGVVWLQRKKKNGRYKPGIWRARIWIEGERLELGTFKDEMQAARAYDAAAVQRLGDRAKLNFQ